MTRKELNDELDRLTKGFHATMTPERADAYWQRFGHQHLADLHEAVTGCLCEPRYPTFEQLAVRLDWAANTRRRQEMVYRDRVAKHAMDRLMQDAMACPERQAFVTFAAGLRQACTGQEKPPLVYRCAKPDCCGNEDGCRQGLACGTGAKWQWPEMVGR